MGLEYMANKSIETLRLKRFRAVFQDGAVKLVTASDLRAAIEVLYSVFFTKGVIKKIEEVDSE